MMPISVKRFFLVLFLFNTCQIYAVNNCHIKKVGKAGVQMLTIGVPVNRELKYNEKIRFSLTMKHPSPLHIRINEVEIIKRLRVQYINVNHTSTFELTNIVYKNYTPNDVYIPCAVAGRYDIIVRSPPKKRTSMQFKIEVLNKPKFTPKIENFVHYINNKLLIKPKFTKNDTRTDIVKWTKSNIDFNVTKYCLVIHTKNVTNMCSVMASLYNGFENGKYPCDEWRNFMDLTKAKKKVIIDRTKPNLVCTEYTPQVTLYGLNPKLRYYVNLFGINENYGNYTIRLASKEIRVETKKAIFGLKANQVQYKTLLRKKVRPTSFSFKSRQNALQVLLIPCRGKSINTTITYLNLKKRKRYSNIFKPTVINLDPERKNNEFNINIIPSNIDHFERYNKVKIAVLTSKSSSNIPDLPDNLSINEDEKYDEHECSGPIISWYKSPDEREVLYNIIVKQINNHDKSKKHNRIYREKSIMEETNYCEHFNEQLYNRTSSVLMSNFEPNKFSPSNKMTHLLSNLTGGQYLVYVTVRLKNVNDTVILPYENLYIAISNACNKIV
ncbi:NDNF family protein [Megaselia abdita]